MTTTSWVNDLREMFTEQVRYKDLLFQMVKRDLLLRYKHTLMGFGWAISMPVLNALIFSVIFTRVAPLHLSVPYPIYIYTGLLPWNWFASSIRFSVPSLTTNFNLVTKVYFPREIFPFSSVLVSMIDFLVASLVLAAMMVYYRVPVSWSLGFLPVLMLVQITFTAGIALLASMSNLFYRDVKYLSELVLSIWMFATSVVYPVDRIGGKLGFFLRLNPMTPLVDGYRSVVLHGRLPPASDLVFTASVAFGILAVGWFLFHRLEFKFAENI
jgi:lipopolysaccharide transport system permease protein